MSRDKRSLEEAPAFPAPGFERELVRELESLVSELPPGVAGFRCGRVPGHPEWPEPYFEVKPANPSAAALKGVSVAGDLDLTIGDAQREFVGFERGGTIVKGAVWQEELRWIWKAVTQGGFAQKHWLDSHGRTIGWYMKIIVNGKELVFRNGRTAERLFARRKVTTVIYDSYFWGGRPRRDPEETGD